MKVFQAPAMLTSFKTLVSGSIKMVFETQELSHEQGATLLSLVNQYGFFAFGPEGEELRVPDNYDSTKKQTQSQMLRYFLGLLWEKQGSHGDKEEFYHTKMEVIIESIKKKLDQEVAIGQV